MLGIEFSEKTCFRGEFGVRVGICKREICCWGLICYKNMMCGSCSKYGGRGNVLMGNMM